MAENDVTPAESSPAAATPQDAPAAGVTTAPAERPIENLAGEFNRKIGKLESKFDQLIATMSAAQQQTARPAPLPQGLGALTEDDLFARAQQGDKEAFAEWNERKANAVYERRQAMTNLTQMVTGQLQALNQQYPQLADPSHPLAQTAQQAYKLMTQQGYPQNIATQLDAIKTAIAGRPDLVAEIHQQGRAQVQEQSRQSASSRSAASQNSASYRRDEPSGKPQSLKVSQEEQLLARRMNIRDPKGAKERFLKRQEEGISKLGGVAAYFPSDVENF